jgi:heme o synthase
MRDYLALTKPKILWLLLLVALASEVIAARALPPILKLAGLLLAGTLTSMGSLALNSYIEMDIDAKMKRTRNRPLPAARIIQPARAAAFGLSLVALGLVISWFTLTPLATLFIGLGAVVYVQVYTVWLKPRTSWNIVLGGFAGSCCALAGWYAITSADPLIAWVLAALVFVWTPTHFWSLAVIAEDDYTAAGIPMLPSVVGEKKAAKFIVANTLLLIPISLLFFLYLAGTGEVLYLVVALIFDVLLLATNIKLLLVPNRSNALLAFKASSPFLAVIFILACVSVLV